MSNDLRLVVVAQEFPYPPNHGGRADVWRRLRAMKSLGVQLALVCWFDDAEGSRPSADELRAVEEVVEVLVAVPKQRGLRQDMSRLMRIVAGVPSHAAARVMVSTTESRVLNRLAAFKPDGVFLDSPYGGVFAGRTCKALGVPMFYRSHNIEHKYFQGQAAAATGLRDRLAWRIACLHLASFEQRMMRSAAISFDISADDASFWRGRGIHDVTCLPPLPEAALEATDPSSGRLHNEARELAFLGNLNAPNNVRGVRWLIEEVMPIVWQQRPKTILTIAGSRPNDEVRALIAKHARVQLMENIADVPGFLASSRVLVNPVLSGSGVNVKTLDMLMTDRPIVSTGQGVAGLAPSIKALCHVADTAGQFANAVLEAIAASDIDLPARKAGRALFSVAAVEGALNLIQNVVRQTPTQLLESHFVEEVTE